MSDSREPHRTLPVRRAATAGRAVGVTLATALVAAGAAALVSAGPAGAQPPGGQPGHDRVVSAVPSAATPDIVNGNVFGIHDAGTKIIAVGNFTGVQNPGSGTTIGRNYVLAFDKATGVVDSAFAPVLDNEANAVIAGPLPGTVYLSGRFNTVNGQTSRKVALLDVADGSLVGGFSPPPFNAAVFDLALAGDQLIVGGIFQTAGSANPRGGLASLDALTGQINDYLRVDLTENHNYDGSPQAAQAPVGARDFALAPDASALVVVGNFRRANDLERRQIVKLDLGATEATISGWRTLAFAPRCAWRPFDFYVRDVDFSPDGTYLAVVTSGFRDFAAVDYCDAVTRFEAGATGEVAPTWANYAGGDTLLSVAVTEQAVYVGGHQRWMNNSSGVDNAQQGAVGRASLSAHDPVSGQVLSWNPGRHPRGIGVGELVPTPDGLWLGHDTRFIGNHSWRRERIAFFPLAGGDVPASTQTATLPGNVYQAGVAGEVAPEDDIVLHRVNAGGPAVPAVDGGPDWAIDTNVDPSPYRVAGGGGVSNSTSPVNSIDGTVPATTPPAVFSVDRFGRGWEPDMRWEFPAPVGAELAVRIYFANRWSGTSQPGQRVFDVRLEGATVLAGFDISAQAGHHTGTMREFSIVSDGLVEIEFGRIVENPLVDAFEIIQTDIPTPPGDSAVAVRAFDGTSSGTGAPQPVPNLDGTPWSTANGGFWVGGTLFYGMNGSLWQRSFDGATFGLAEPVNPYSDPNWDNVFTSSGGSTPTYAGVPVVLYGQLGSVTGMFYEEGRLYYTRQGTNLNGLYWRWFHPDSGAIGSQQFTAATTGFGASGGVFAAGGNLYLVNRTTGTLSVRPWVDGAPAGSFTVISGPTVDGHDWRGTAVFLGP